MGNTGSARRAFVGMRGVFALLALSSFRTGARAGITATRVGASSLKTTLLGRLFTVRTIMIQEVDTNLARPSLTVIKRSVLEGAVRHI